MYRELMFSPLKPAKGDAYVGGGVYLPPDVRWPTSDNGEPLVHLMSLPGWWFGENIKGNDFSVSIFIPYASGQVNHYRRLRERDGCSEAVVVGHPTGEFLRSESANEIKDVGRVEISLIDAIDDSENLASKIDGVDAWLQCPIAMRGMHRRISIYGGDLDLALPKYKGILADGMGYLFIDDDAIEGRREKIGHFFLQLG